MVTTRGVRDGTELLFDYDVGKTVSDATEWYTVRDREADMASEALSTWDATSPPPQAATA